MAPTGTEEQPKKARYEGAHPSSKGGRIHPSLLLGLSVALVLLIVINPFAPPSTPPIPTEVSLRETIYVTALALNAEHEDIGSFPADLETIGMDQEGLTYTPSSTGYTLVAEADGVRVAFQSGDDLEPFRSAFEALLPPFREVR